MLLTINSMFTVHSGHWYIYTVTPMTIIKDLYNKQSNPLVIIYDQWPLRKASKLGIYSKLQIQVVYSIFILIKYRKRRKNENWCKKNKNWRILRKEGPGALKISLVPKYIWYFWSGFFWKSSYQIYGIYSWCKQNVK